MNTNGNIKLEIITKKNKLEDQNKSLEKNLDKLINKIQVNTSRCMLCNKKIGLTGFKCKCKYYFCAKHSYSDRHECTFDYKQFGKELLKNSNPVIISSKIDLF